MVKLNTKSLDKATLEIYHIFWKASKDYNCVYCDALTKQIIAYPPFYEEVPICNSNKCIDRICNIITNGVKVKKVK